MKSLKAMLREGRPIVGLTMQHVTDSWLAKLYRQSGCDFVYLEYEHAFFNEANLAAFVLACRAEGLPVVAKVPELTRTHVAKLLECGVIGIQLPWTESREQIDRLVSYVKFPPTGIRAAGPGYGNTDYRIDVEVPEFIAEADRETVVIAHVETRTGVENIDSILANPYVDVVFLGIYDLSISYGQPGRFDHADFKAAVETVLASAKRHGKVMGLFAPDGEFARRWQPRGATFFETLSEVDFILQGAKNHVGAFR